MSHLEILVTQHTFLYRLFSYARPVDVANLSATSRQMRKYIGNDVLEEYALKYSSPRHILQCGVEHFDILRILVRLNERYAEYQEGGNIRWHPDFWSLSHLYVALLHRAVRESNWIAAKNIVTYQFQYLDVRRMFTEGLEDTLLRCCKIGKIKLLVSILSTMHSGKECYGNVTKKETLITILKNSIDVKHLSLVFNVDFSVLDIEDLIDANLNIDIICAFFDRVHMNNPEAVLKKIGKLSREDVIEFLSSRLYDVVMFYVQHDTSSSPLYPRFCTLIGWDVPSDLFEALFSNARSIDFSVGAVETIVGCYCTSGVKHPMYKGQLLV